MSRRVSLLVTVATRYGKVEIRGPLRPPAGLMRGVDAGTTGSLRIRSFPTAIEEASYANSEGSLVGWSEADACGPRLYEETTYQLLVHGRERVPEILHRDPLLTRDLATHRELRLLAGTINYRREVGHTALTFRFGTETLVVELEVTPTKLDYATDYWELIAALEAQARGLALAYLRSTFQLAGVDDQHSGATAIEWLTLLRQVLVRLRQATAAITRKPIRELAREERVVPVRKLRHPDATARRAAMRGAGAGPTVPVPGVGAVRSRLPTRAAHASLNNPENRWIATRLRDVLQRLREMLLELDRQLAATSRRRRSQRRLSEREEVAGFIRQVEQLLRAEPLRAVSGGSQPAVPSLALLKTDGYRDIYKILEALRRALRLDGGPLQLSVRDLHELYESWCFLEVVKIVAEATGATPDATDLVEHYRDGLRVRLRAGRRSDVRLVDGDRSITVSYNPSYPGQTGRQRPDVVLEIQQRGGLRVVVVLDAKYRVDATAEYRKTFGAPGPPVDAVNALHRYRDAIVLNAAETHAVRPVVRGVALFPLTPEETLDFTESTLFAALSSLGIGALPFLPGNTQLAENWLHGLLEIAGSMLVWNGPPGPEMPGT